MMTRGFSIGPVGTFKPMASLGGDQHFKPHRKYATTMPAMSASYKGAGHGTMNPMVTADTKRIASNFGPENIAACIVEPIAGSTGTLVPPKGYLQKLREICDKHGILLIFDEVITGWGRTGSSFEIGRASCRERV